MVTLWDNIRDNSYDQHDSLLGPRDPPLPMSTRSLLTHRARILQLQNFHRAIKMQADTFPEMDDPFELPQRDASANLEVIFQVELNTELTEEQLSCLCRQGE
jgi:hypothetical protein